MAAESILLMQSPPSPSCGFVLGLSSLFSEPIYVQHMLEHGDNPLKMAEVIGFGGDFALDWLADLAGCSGPKIRLDSACATGNDAVILAAQWLQSELCDHVLVVCASAMLNPIGLALFRNIGALNDGSEPQASCPFDSRRRGFVMGEGSAALLLSRRPTHETVGLSGYGQSMNAYKFTDLPDHSEPMARAMRNAWPASRLPAYISAHGTATPQNDRVETQLFKTLFGDQAGELQISATKSMTGHCLSATALMESIVCVEALKRQMAPPTLNLNQPDPECDLNYTPHSSMPIFGTGALNPAFAFGGHNSVTAWSLV